MKHVIMVIGHGSGKVLQKTINCLDDVDIDFFIHWDKKYPIPSFHSNHSKIHFIKNRKLFWGTDTQILVEKQLLEEALNASCEYQYFHLISSNDIPLMTVAYFKQFFSSKSYVGFVKNVTESDRRRIKWFYPIRNLDVRKGRNYHLVIQPLKLMNYILRIDRNKKNLPIEKGTNWFSIRRQQAWQIVSYPYFNRFLHSFLGDELYAQSILYKMKSLSDQSLDDNTQAARYVDWNRGTPFTFGTQEIAELQERVNTRYAFARKVENPELIDKVFNSELDC